MSNSPNKIDSNINIAELFEIIWKKKITLFIYILFFVIAGTTYAFSMPNIYKSQAILSSVQIDNNINRNIQNYSSIASLAGIDLSNSNTVNQKAEALKKIESLSFFSNHILPNIYLANLMAKPKWNEKDNVLIYDSNRYDMDNNKWMKQHLQDGYEMPTSQESYEKFKDLLLIEDDKSSGFITISIHHQSPYIAKDWIDLIFKQINHSMRMEKKEVVEKSIQFLNTKMQETNFSETKQVLSQLIENQMQQLVMIEANENYIFKYIDPPFIPENPYGPKRISMILYSLLLGTITGAIIILCLYLLRKRSILSKKDN